MRLVPTPRNFVQRGFQPNSDEKIMSTLRETFLEELAYIYDAEKQLLKALPKMVEAARNPELKSGFEMHLNQTEGHVNRLEQVFQVFGERAKGKKCKAMKGLIAEGEDLIDEDEGDAALICAAQKVEHYEIASYGSLKAWAQQLDQQDAARLLEQTLNEEKATDDKLTQVAENVVNLQEEQEDAEHAHTE
jgi:ferritin-like metal-binding protein YciE